MGRPDTKELERNIYRENSQFQDIIVLNASEGYYYTTAKMMIAIMVISKFCPDTKYVIKTDDDVYLRLAKLEQVVVKLQQMLNKKASENGPRGQKKLSRKGAKKTVFV